MELAGFSHHGTQHSKYPHQTCVVRIQFSIIYHNMINSIEINNNIVYFRQKQTETTFRFQQTSQW